MAIGAVALAAGTGGGVYAWVSGGDLGAAATARRLQARLRTSYPFQCGPVIDFPGTGIDYKCAPARAGSGPLVAARSGPTSSFAWLVGVHGGSIELLYPTCWRC